MNIVFTMSFNHQMLKNFNCVFSSFKKAENTLKRFVENRKNDLFPWTDLKLTETATWKTVTDEPGWASYEFLWDGEKVEVLIERMIIDAEWKGD